VGHRQDVRADGGALRRRSRHLDRPLNAATNAQGTLDELYTIAAAVIGGTSLAGGVGTIAGAMLGAIVMQSLNSGMVLLGLDTPLQSIVIGIVLVVAVWLDTVYRSRAK
jgi:D-xylose transport system permease protein